MKECIMSFFNAPISNQVPSGVTSVKQLHTYITSNEWSGRGRSPVPA